MFYVYLYIRYEYYIMHKLGSKYNSLQTRIKILIFHITILVGIITLLDFIVCEAQKLGKCLSVVQFYFVYLIHDGLEMFVSL